jgi:hypothetical protein
MILRGIAMAMMIFCGTCWHVVCLLPLLALLLPFTQQTKIRKDELFFEAFI